MKKFLRNEIITWSLLVAGLFVFFGARVAYDYAGHMVRAEQKTHEVKLAKHYAQLEDVVREIEIDLALMQKRSLRTQEKHDAAARVQELHSIAHNIDLTWLAYSQDMSLHILPEQKSRAIENNYRNARNLSPAITRFGRSMEHVLFEMYPSRAQIASAQEDLHLLQKKMPFE